MESGNGMVGKRAGQAQLAALRAEVQSLQARLSADVSTLDPGDDPMSRQALADASERQTAAGSLLATATTGGETRGGPGKRTANRVGGAHRPPPGTGTAGAPARSGPARSRDAHGQLAHDGQRGRRAAG